MVSGGGTGTTTLPGSGKTKLTGSSEVPVIGLKVIGGKITVRSLDGAPEPTKPAVPPVPSDGIKLTVDVRTGVNDLLTLERTNSKRLGRSKIKFLGRGRLCGDKNIGLKTTGAWIAGEKVRVSRRTGV